MAADMKAAKASARASLRADYEKQLGSPDATVAKRAEAALLAIAAEEREEQARERREAEQADLDAHEAERQRIIALSQASRDRIAGARCAKWLVDATEIVKRFIANQRPVDAELFCKMWRAMNDATRLEQGGLDASPDVFNAPLLNALDKFAFLGERNSYIGMGESSFRVVGAYAAEKIAPTAGKPQVDPPGPNEAADLLNDLLVRAEEFAKHARFPDEARAKVLALSLTNRLRTQGLAALVAEEQRAAKAASQAEDERLQREEPGLWAKIVGRGKVLS